MIKFDFYVNKADGQTTKENVFIKQINEGDVNLVYVDATTNANGAFIDGKNGVCIDVQLEGNREFMATHRYSQWWTEPFFSNNLKDLPKQTQYLVAKNQDGLFEVFVPVVGEKYKCVFENKSENCFTARVYSLYEGLFECKQLAFVYGIGKDPFYITEQCVKSALNALSSPVKHVKERNYPDILEYLGWCTWDAMQIRVCEDGIIEKCEEFKQKNIPVKWVIFDDMWAHIETFKGKTYQNFDEMIKLMYSSTLHDYEADPDRFPSGLKASIKKVNDYGIKVGMWHPTGGYWAGIEKDGKAYEKLKDYLTLCERGQIVPDYPLEKTYAYYKTIHDFFKDCGAEFVKIDEQSVVDFFYQGKAPIGEIAKNMHDGIEKSVSEHFGDALINCMGMASECIWSRRNSPISRCSDDFVPENKQWFKKHIQQCAYNSVFQGQFYYCDWDMWWTDDGQAKRNSIVRAISGGPIYVSDKIGRSIGEIIKPLTLANGRILRCDRPCLPTADCLTTDCKKSKTAIKLQNIAGKHGVMAVFNIDENEENVSAYISGEQITGFDADEYAVYEHFSGELKILKRGQGFTVRLKDAEDCKLYIFAPIENGFAVIGRTDKFISPKTILNVENEKITLVENGRYAFVKDGKLVVKES